MLHEFDKALYLFYGERFLYYLTILFVSTGLAAVFFVVVVFFAVVVVAFFVVVVAFFVVVVAFFVVVVVFFWA